MPWVVKKDDRCPVSKPWGVTNQQTGHLHGCHPSREHGLKQAAALYASVDDSRPARSAPEPEDATSVPAGWASVTGGLMQPRDEQEPEWQSLAPRR